MAILGIFLAASRLFKCFKNSFYLFTGILNQAKHIKYNKRSRLASFYVSICRSLLLKVKAVFRLYPYLLKTAFIEFWNVWQQPVYY